MTIRGALALVAALGAGEGAAVACGCFAPPNPSVPVVQAGERILFVRQNGVVTAHIQIQYQGDAAEFGWLLPLPSQPTLTLGTDELFTQLIATTQPKYVLTRKLDGCGFTGSAQDAKPSSDGGPGGGGPVAVQSSIGPYDYAVLHADDKAVMLAWLADNHYFVPAGTDDVVGPYIHPGGYFLALKLRSGQSAGDLQPVVVTYPSDLPMIPIVLTSVTAQPDMGIQVWMLGAARAIPRNYYDTVLDDTQIDWLQAGANYNDLIIRATKEADGRHTFVTEYAGSSAPMVGVLDYPGRFGTQAALAALTDPVAFIEYVDALGFVPGGRVVSSVLLGVLQTALPPPAAFASLPPAQFYAGIQYLAATQPEGFAGWHPDFKPADVAAELWTRIAAPTLAAGQLFRDHPYLTRLYTTLSPAEMNKDPVFSESALAPDVSNVHTGTLTIHCAGGGPANAPATLVTAQGWIIQYPGGVGAAAALSALPASMTIGVLSEDQAPQVVVSNVAAIQAAISAQPTPGGEAAGGGAGCSVGPGGGGGGAALALAALALRRSRRRPRRAGDR